MQIQTPFQWISINQSFWSRQSLVNFTLIVIKRVTWKWNRLTDAFRHARHIVYSSSIKKEVANDWHAFNQAINAVKYHSVLAVKLVREKDLTWPKFGELYSQSRTAFSDNMAFILDMRHGAPCFLHSELSSAATHSSNFPKFRVLLY